jgi:hypothetical protein
VKVRKKPLSRVSQGDVYRDIELVEYVYEKKGNIEISKIIFPLGVVLTQDCDLKQDSNVRRNWALQSNQDKLILSVLVAPLYNVEHVYQGEHLDQLDNIKMQLINKSKTAGKNLRNNDNPRYHFLDFPLDIPIVPSVIDFKHYFSVNVNYLKKKKKDLVCRVSPLYREDISQRFAAFLSRIGLP